jgi:PPOX class probable F420-dependent enzyme
METMRGLMEPAPVGRLATVRDDGRAHVVPICFVLSHDLVLSHDVVYTAVDDKPKRHERLQRVRNIAATGTASLLIDNYHDDWSRLWWVRLDGRARLVDSDAEIDRAIRSLLDKYVQYRDHPPAGPVLALDVDDWVGRSATT